MSASTSTSGIFTLYSMYVNSDIIHAIVVTASISSVIALYPDFYRKDFVLDKKGIQSLSFMVLSYYMLYLGFVFFTGIIKLYIF